MTVVGDELVRIGLSPENAARKETLHLQCASMLAASGAAAARFALWVPGRIEVFGKHTDYAGGRSLVCAIERGICLRVAPRKDRQVRVTDILRGSEFAAPLDATSRARRGSWGAYVAAVVRRFARDLPQVQIGVDIAMASDLPPAAGLSSSSAIVVGTALSILAVNDLWPGNGLPDSIPTMEALAGYLGAVENGAAFEEFSGDEGVGTFGGSEDHTAILCCRAGMLSQFSFAPVRRDVDVALPSCVRLVVGVSGVTSSKTRNARQRYNRLSIATRRLLSAWNSAEGRNDRTLAQALRSSPSAIDRLRELAPAAGDAEFSSAGLADRLEQFVEESELIVPAGSSAVAREAWEEFGRLADRSQQLAELRLCNQVPETVMLQRLARLHGALAASAFGGGFGGSVWAMVDHQKEATFVTQWQRSYRERGPRIAPRSHFFTTRAGPPATVWPC